MSRLLVLGFMFQILLAGLGWFECGPSKAPAIEWPTTESCWHVRGFFYESDNHRDQYVAGSGIDLLPALRLHLHYSTMYRLPRVGSDSGPIGSRSPVAPALLRVPTQKNLRAGTGEEIRRFGLPFPWLQVSLREDSGTMSIINNDGMLIRNGASESYLPTTVLWLRGAASVLSTSMVVSIARYASLFVLRMNRRRGGRCPECGYMRSPSVENNVCPECGSDTA